ncbi:MAG: glycosyltransferase [Caldilineales bacterium]|nr:glycosyltransferase [Caldilineales bacterium]MDW8318434.1 glycosyltransferase [Anaerolineae bacterium]
MSGWSHLWSYLVLLLLVAVQGELAILAGAGAAASGVLDPRAVLLVATLGNTLADVAWYLLGYHSRPQRILNRLPRLGITEEQWVRLQGFIRRDAVRLLVVAKATNWMTIPVLVAMGAARAPWRRWFPVVVLSNAAIAAALVLVGYYTTASLLQVRQGMGYVALGAGVLLALFGVFYGRRWLQQLNPLARPTAETQPASGPSPLRVLVCSTAYHPHLNGQAVFVTKLCEGLAACGHQVLVLTAHEPGLARREIVQGVEVARVPALHLHKVHQDLHVPVRASSVVQQVFERFRPQIVHVHDPSPLSEAAMRQARRLHIPVLATHHVGPAVTSPYLRTKNPLLNEVAAKAVWRVLIRHLTRADQVVVPSAYSASMLAAHGLQKPIRVIPCGVQLDRFYPDPALDRQAVRLAYGLDVDKTLFLYVGRIDIEKRLDLVVRALALAADDAVQLAIAGSGTEEASLRRLAEQLGVSHQVRFLGQVPHDALPALLNAADVFVMPGDSESFSMATLEAMACGKPILAVAAGAVPQLVSHGVNGYLYEPHQPESAAHAMRCLAGDPQLRGEMGRASAERARQYSQTRTVHAYRELYHAWSSRYLPSASPAGKERGHLRRRSWLLPLVVSAVLGLLLAAGLILFSELAQVYSHQQLAALAPALGQIFGQWLHAASPSAPWSLDTFHRLLTIEAA